MPRPRRSSQMFNQRVSQLEFGPNLPVFRAFSDSNNIQTLQAGGGDTPLTFNFWENGNDNVFSPNVSGGLLVSVETLMEGVYGLTAQFNFGDFGAMAGVNVGVCFEEGGMDFSSPAGIMPAQPLAGNNSSGMLTWTFIKGYPPFWMRATASTCALAPCMPTWQLRGAQDDTVDHDLTVIYMECYLLGGLSVDTNEIP